MKWNITADKGFAIVLLYKPKTLRTVFVILLLLNSLQVGAQNAAYWQQRVDTKIEVRLDDAEHFLHAHLSLDYYNQSPDTLRFIYFHLYPNAYRTDRSAFARQDVANGSTDFYFSKKEQRGYLDSLQFLAQTDEGEEAKLGMILTEHPDIVKVILQEPLLPGSQIKLSTPFRVKIPEVFSRMGHSGQAYYLSQWFPKPAVYDAKGWHPYPYLNQGEFYSEYGSYEVAISLPANYILMATGNIVEEQEQRWLDSLTAIPLPPDTLYKNSNPPSAPNYKTVTFKEENVHDFAWFADKRWVVRKESIPLSDSEITAYTAFAPQHQKAWALGLASLKKTVNEFSKRVGPYPYKTIKAVEGLLVAGGAMEYPTITLIGGSKDPGEVHTLIVHEAGHNWFYGILGNNERLYPWMDESLNSFYENKIAPDSLNKGNQLLGGQDPNYFGYMMLAANGQTVPANSPSFDFPQLNYATDVYGKGAFYFKWLEDYMGEPAFQAAMQEYFATWKFKHPQPEDFEQLFKKHSIKNLSWFFEVLLPSAVAIDYSIAQVNRTENGTVVKLKNKSDLPLPVPVVRTVEGKVVEKHWTEPFLGTASLKFEGQEGLISIGSSVTDYNMSNNEERSPFRLKPFLGWNTHADRRAWVLPALGYNVYDRFLVGAVFHNLTIPKNKFQYALVPLYALGSKSFAGTGFINYSSYPQSDWLHSWHVRLSGKTFSFDKNNLNIDHYLYRRFIKVAPELVFEFKKPYYRSPIERSISLKTFWIREGQLAFNQDPTDSLYRPNPDQSKDLFYARVQYLHKNTRTFNPLDYCVEGQLGQQFAKLSLTAQLRIDYHLKNKAIYIRGYAGKFFNLASNPYDAYRYRLTQTSSGIHDYLYEETYLGRSEVATFPAQQISMREGGFKINTLQYANPIGLSDDWLFALNLKTDLPLAWVPLRLYADLGYSTAFNTAEQQRNLLYSAGLELYLGKYLSLYIPVLMSPVYSEYQTAIFPKNRFWHSISFSLNLKEIDWLNIGSGLVGN